MWNWLIPIGASLLGGLFGSQGGNKPQTFNYMPGMQQFWRQFQNRLKNPPPQWGGIQPGQTGLPQNMLDYIMQSPFPMWGKYGLPFLTGQQNVATQLYGIDRGSRQQFLNSLAGIGSAIAYFLTMQNNKPNTENLKGMDLLGGYYPYLSSTFGG